MGVVMSGSGRASNAEAILKAQQAGKLARGQVVQIYSAQPAPGILALAKKYDVSATCLDPTRFKTKLDAHAQQHYVAPITACEAELVVLAGFMRVLKEPFLAFFAGKIINIQPSLLPSFPRLDGIGQAFRRGVKITGCTVHR